jgi:hypothetical protein
MAQGISHRCLNKRQNATKERGESIYDQGEASGFIRLNPLRIKVAAKVQA